MKKDKKFDWGKFFQVMAVLGFGLLMFVFLIVVANSGDYAFHGHDYPARP